MIRECYNHGYQSALIKLGVDVDALIAQAKNPRVVRKKGAKSKQAYAQFYHGAIHGSEKSIERDGLMKGRKPNKENYLSTHDKDHTVIGKSFAHTAKGVFLTADPLYAARFGHTDTKGVSRGDLDPLVYEVTIPFKTALKKIREQKHELIVKVDSKGIAIPGTEQASRSFIYEGNIPPRYIKRYHGVTFTK